MILISRFIKLDLLLIKKIIKKLTIDNMYLLMCISEEFTKQSLTQSCFSVDLKITLNLNKKKMVLVYKNFSYWRNRKQKSYSNHNLPNKNIPVSR